jgi:hypothetical protein
MPEKTLADFPDLMFAARVHRDAFAVFDQTCPSTEVFAPCCGRRTAADSILDVRDVKGTVVRGGGHQPAKDHDWLCDGCRHRLYHDSPGGWTPVKLMTACRARPETIRSLKIHERLAELAREDSNAGRAHEPVKAHARAVKEIDGVVS